MNRRTTRSVQAHRAVAVAIETLETRRLLAYTAGDTYYGAFGGEAFGAGIATNGDLALIAAPGSPEVRLVNTVTKQVEHVFTDPDPLGGDQFPSAMTFVGDKIAISDQGNLGAGDYGKVYIWDPQSSYAMTSITAAAPNDPVARTFGYSLASDGVDLFVSEGFADADNNTGKVYRYSTSGGSPLKTYEIADSLTNTTQLGYHLGVSNNHVFAAYIDLNAANDTKIAVFDKADETQRATIASSASLFGSSLLVLPSGEFYVGAQENVFKFAADFSSAGTYQSPATGGGFGEYDIDVDDQGNLFVSAPAGNGGVVYVYKPGDTASDDTITKPAGEDIGEFGWSVGTLSGGRIIVGDPFDDNINGFEAGAAFVFESDIAVPPPTGPTIVESDGVLVVTGTGDAETITIVKLEAGFTAVSIGSSPSYNFTGSSIVVHAGGGDDVIGVGASVTANVEIYGGLGNDSMSGGAGTDILVGGEGNDIIYGHTGRDLLIGGAGDDKLYGEVGDDILIAGSTGYDEDPTGLQTVMGVWTDLSMSYDMRVAALRDMDWLNTTLYSDDGKDLLYGRNGDDWFIFDEQDTTDLKLDETSGIEADLNFIPA